MVQVSVHSEQELLEIATQQIVEAVQRVCTGEGFTKGQINIAVIDGPAIHELNRQWLQHDYPTDVLSFLMEQDGPHLEGDVFVSAEMALEMAPQFGWNAADELLLYVVHGVLHLTGHDDQTDDALQLMREKERFYLEQFGLHPNYDSREAPSS